MGLFGLFGENINQHIEDARGLSNSVIIDIRDPADYVAGHIEGACNLLISQLADVEKLAESKDAPVFVYCYGGVLSKTAKSNLEQMGYTNVVDAGGINRWKGALVLGPNPR